MSQKNTSKTIAVQIRDLTPRHKDKIRNLLKYGDAGKIAILVRSCGYQQVLNVLSPTHPTDNDEVWEKAIEHLSKLPEVEIDERFASYVFDEDLEAA
ncbi:MAG: hypothetical protein RLN83_08140 [Balneola sp.]